MDITFTDAAFIVGVITVANVISTVLIGAFTPKPQMPMKLARGDMINLIEEINALVDLEFLAVVEAPNVIRKIDTITDFDEIQKEITRSVVEAFSTKLFIMANNAGLKRKFILTVVTRRTTYNLFKYMKTHNFSLKK